MIKLHYGGGDRYFNEQDVLIPNLHYQTLCNIPSDINEHLPVLKKYAEECEHITEMGVRYACSTWAFIEAKPKKLLCYDIDYKPFEPSEQIIKKMCENYEIEFEFILGDCLKLDIEKTDLLFIDTLHTYNQLILELNKHSKNVNKYIILHDTTLFGHNDEYVYGHASDLVKNSETKKFGLIPAIDDFIKENTDWIVFESHSNNNGLTILKNIKSQ